jgi:DNA-binding LacI/PurR family transcriptional regulator
MARPRRPTQGLPRLEHPPGLLTQVEHLLRQAIADGYFASGRLPPLAELAEQLGVSRETVRLACARLQQEGLIRKIRRRGTFLEPVCLLRRLTAKKARVLFYLQADYAASPLSETGVVETISGLMLQGALQACCEQNIGLLVRQVAIHQVQRVLSELLQTMPAAGLIFASFGEEKVVRAALGLGVPIVLLDHDLPSVQVHSVRDDSYQAAKDVVAHLVQLGHRRIAFVNWRREDLNPWRLRGYRDGLREAGLPHRRAWEVGVPLNRSGARQAVEQLLALRPRLTAFYCFNNTLARYVCEELQARQYRVPEDFSVVGGGGESVTGLTCHQADWQTMGRLAVEILLRHQGSCTAGIQQSPGSPSSSQRAPEHHVCPHRFLPGSTVAPPLSL